MAQTNVLHQHIILLQRKHEMLGLLATCGFQNKK